jgi:protein-disulfide isomerase
MLGTIGLIWWILLRPHTPPPNIDAEIPVPTEAVRLADAAVTGADDAPVVMIVYSDFDCPYCQRFAVEILPELETEFISPGTMQLAFRHLPLDAIHPRARSVAEAAECARRRGQFWTFHDAYFGRPNVQSASAAGGVLGIAALAIAPCVGAAEAVARDLADAEQLRISSTPAFLVGLLRPDGTADIRKTIRGAKPLTEFRAAIADVLALRAN